MQKGFTLIELLVVISIIVVLASIVLVGVQNATQKAADARIISAVAQYRSQAEIYRSEVGSYTGLADAWSTYADIRRIYTDLSSQGVATTSIVKVGNSGANYCVRVGLKANNARDVYCADSLGNAKTLTASSTLCTETSYQCGD